MRAANKSGQEAKRPKVDERGRRRNAARKARRMMEKKADSMPVVELSAPRQVRVVDAELVDPAPSGGIREVFQQRYLLKLIVTRQLAQMYAASVLGLLWSYIQPALRFVVYFFVFGVVLTSHSGTPNFAMRLFAGMVFVHYFTETWNSGTRSVWGNKNLVMKMRVPREIFPIASMVTAAYHTGPQILILAITAVLLGWQFSWAAVAALVLGLAILIPLAMSLALIFSALNVYYRDFQNIVQTMNQFTHFLVPMMYAYSMIHKLSIHHEWAYQLYFGNPLAEATLLMQRAFWAPTLRPEQYAAEFPSDLWVRGLIQLVACLLLLLFAQKFFARLEAKFPERL